MRPMPAIRAVAFDLDGLMFDTEALFVRVAREMLAARGKVFTAEIMAAMIGRQWAVAGPAFKAMAELSESLDELLEELWCRFGLLLESEVSPAPGLLDLMDHLEGLELPRCVATSSRREYAQGLLDRHGLTPRLSFLLGAEDIARSKPDPEIYLKAANRFGVAPGSLLVLEDSPAGVAAGKAAGAFVVALPHEHSPARALRDADMIVNRLDEDSLLRSL
jgi:HAD superfamily hydrolase (TIGR01509 family)